MTSLCLTLDYINDICDPASRIAVAADRVQAHEVIARANDVLGWARRRGHLVAHVKVGFGPDYIQCPDNSPIFGAAKRKGALQLGTWGTEFCGSLDVARTDPVIVKHRVSGFYNTELETILRSRGIDHLILMGVSTENAVELTAREAHDRDYAVTVVADACQSGSEAVYRASLQFLSRIALVASSSELTG